MKHPAISASILLAIISVLFGVLFDTNYYSLPTVIDNDDAKFSGTRAWNLLDEILGMNNYEPHAWGSIATEKVSDFIHQYALDLQANSSASIQVEYQIYETTTAFRSNDFLVEDANVTLMNRTFEQQFEDRFETRIPVNWTAQGWSAKNISCDFEGAFYDAPCKIRNIAVLINGTESSGDGKGLHISAHHDSESFTSGASDDGSGMVTVLEMMRFYANNPPKKDVVLSLFDAEEQGLLGSFLFRKRSMFKDVASVLVNVEAGGVAQRDYLLKANSNFVLERYNSFAPHKLAFSLVSFIDSALKVGYTDSTNLMKSGYHALDLVFLENRPHYHQFFDHIGFIKPEALQRVGDNVLSVSQGMMDGEMPERLQEGDNFHVGDETNEITRAHLGSTAPTTVYTTIWGLMLYFPSIGLAQGILATLAVVLGLLSVVVFGAFKRATSDVFGSTPSSVKGLLLDTLLVFGVFLAGIVGAFISYAIFSSWKLFYTYYLNFNNSYRVGVTIFSVVFTQLTVIWLWSRSVRKKNIGKYDSLESSDSLESKRVSEILDDPVDTLDDVANLAERLYNGVNVFYSILLLLTSFVMVHLAPTFLWVPLMFPVARALQVALLSFGVSDNVAVNVRDILGLFVPMLLMMDVLTVLTLTFPYFVEYPRYEGFAWYIFPLIVGMLGSLVSIIFLPLFVRVVGHEGKYGLIVLVGLAVCWLVLNLLQSFAVGASVSDLAFVPPS